MSDKDGNLIGYVEPERGERTFHMSLLIKKAIDERIALEDRRQKDKEWRQKQEASGRPVWTMQPPGRRMGLIMTAAMAAAMMPPHGR
jgi:hypothetical protein